MKNKTAVEWLRSKMLIECLEPSDELFEQALAMEKEQIMSAFAFGVYDGGGIIKKYKMSEEQYYNETFKSE